ncbi:hypothetical protein [Acidithiobacillus sp.]|uniref:hypothetical protein n=1 Tax=Acidithiobacillus sp. TaxID=1872118 RepID=UPI002610FA47|nr:hypothetical protein [Acidithiobacillus sp.]
MTHACPQCASPLTRPRSALQLLRSRASASEWYQFLTTPAGAGPYSCPQCHTGLQRQTTWLGYLLLVSGVVAMYVTMVVWLTLFPAHSLGSALALIPAVLSMIPFFAASSMEWGYTWKLGGPEAGAHSTPPRKKAEHPSGPTPSRDWVDRTLTGALILFAALAVASYVMLWADLAILPPVFWGHGLLERNHSGTAPLFWLWLAMTVFTVRRNRRPRAGNGRTPLKLPAWGLAWLVAMAALYGLDAFTRLHGCLCVRAGEALFTVTGALFLGIGQHRQRKALGIPRPAYMNVRWVPMAIIAGAALIIVVFLAEYTR